MRSAFFVVALLAVSGCATQSGIGRAEFYPLLRLAASAGDEFTVELLLARGADPTGFRDYEACRRKHGYGTEPSSHVFVAAYAGELGVVRLLADAGADLNAREGEGQTPLWIACARGHLEIARLLVGRGARHDLAGEGLTPLQVAEKRGFTAIVALLRQEPGEVR